MRRKFSLASLVAVLVLLGPVSVPAQGRASGKTKTPAVAPLDAAEILKTLDYRAIGPTRQSGRFVDFAVPLQRPNTFYAAAASGGLWKTENNGQTFEPLFENEKVFSIGDVAVAPSNPDILWLGSGEANNSRSTYWGDGVYKSADAGKTWRNMGLKESHHIGRILINPANSNTVYVAALGHLYSENAERGVYKTTDGGIMWTRVLDVVADGRTIGVVDLVMDPADPETLYAASYDRLRKPWTFQLGGPGSGIHKSADGGRTWTKLTNGLPGGILGRIGLAISQKNPKVLYAMVENANKPGMSPEDRWKEIVDGKSSRGMIDGEIYRSDDAGSTWRKVSPDKLSIGGAPGYYYGQIIIDPNNDENVFILSVGVLGSRDGGKTWEPPFRFGGDNHALWIDPKDSSHMLLGYDHGMGVTWDGGKNWYHPDFLSLAQFYAIDFDMSYPYRVAGGLQDNGSLMGPSTKAGGGPSGRRGVTGGGIPPGPPIRLEDWFGMGGGDGMYNVFDRATNRYLYNESQFGLLSRVDLVTGESKGISYQRLKPETRWNWCAPIHVSVHNSDTIYHCGNIVVMSTNRGESWTEISPDLTTNDKSKMQADGKGGDGNIQYGTITTFDESPLVPGLLWAGTDDGNVWVSRDNGKAWTKLNDKIAGNPGYWVSRVAASNFDPGTAYVSYTGLRNDDFRPFVYKTTDYGATWTPLAGGLAEGSVNVIREDVKNPNLLFAGTDFGVYVSIDGGKAWMKMKNDLPTQPVHDLKVHPREADLIVATHGRGAYIVDIKPLQELTSEVLTEDIHLFAIESKVRWVGSDRRESSSSNFAGESEPAGLVVYYSFKAKPKGDVKIQVYAGNMLLNEITGAAEVGLNKAFWNMTGRHERTASASFPVQPGEYRFVLSVDGKTQTASASILKDPRY